MRARNVRVELDLRNEKLGLKIREATLLRVPYMLVVGDKEVAERGVSPRSREGTSGALEPLETFVERVCREAVMPGELSGRSFA